MVWLPDGEKKFENMLIRFDRMYERVGLGPTQTHRHRMTVYAALANHRAARHVARPKHMGAGRFLRGQNAKIPSRPPSLPVPLPLP